MYTAHGNHDMAGPLYRRLMVMLETIVFREHPDDTISHNTMVVVFKRPTKYLFVTNLCEASGKRRLGDRAL